MQETQKPTFFRINVYHPIFNSFTSGHKIVKYKNTWKYARKQRTEHKLNKNCQDSSPVPSLLGCPGTTQLTIAPLVSHKTQCLSIENFGLDVTFICNTEIRRKHKAPDSAYRGIVTNTRNYRGETQEQYCAHWSPPGSTGSVTQIFCFMNWLQHLCF